MNQDNDDDDDDDAAEDRVRLDGRSARQGRLEKDVWTAGFRRLAMALKTMGEDFGAR